MSRKSNEERIEVLENKLQIYHATCMALATYVVLDVVNAIWNIF